MATINSLAQRSIALKNGKENPPADELDDLFDYDIDANELFREIDTSILSSKNREAPSSRPGVELGIDEEVKVARKKRVTVKLDEEKLLSQAGIPKLKRISKERLKFKGKGHEYTNAQRLLSLYQLWLDDLYPKAKFNDALYMVEKLGHHKRIREMRETWLEEGRLSASKHEDVQEIGESIENADVDVDAAAATVPAPMGPPIEAEDPFARQDSALNVDRLKTPPINPYEEGDLYNVTPSPKAISLPLLNVPRQAASPRENSSINLEPAEDDLDELFAEQFAEISSTSVAALPTSGRIAKPQAVDDDFADEMEAMEAMDMKFV
ncbi:MAG: chromosome segregation in meiosis- protein [Trizodia sp. TS-e1964]|nr:MAG: chromosome segregation in meiosis- protein [Trizodia sp. TS-e1964]